MWKARRQAILLAATLGVAALAIVIAVLNPDGTEQATGRTTQADSPFIRLLAEPVDGFALVDSERPLRFPEDHGAHRQQRTEAWALSGVLNDANSRLRAAQMTIFRVGLSAGPITRQSEWAANEVYAGIFAISYAESSGPDVADRASRAAVGLAGTRADPLRIWIDDCSRLRRLSSKSKDFLKFFWLSTFLLICRPHHAGKLASRRLAKKPTLTGTVQSYLPTW